MSIQRHIICTVEPSAYVFNYIMLRAADIFELTQQLTTMNNQVLIANILFVWFSEF